MDLPFSQRDFSPCGEWGPTSVDTGRAFSGGGSGAGSWAQSPGCVLCWKAVRVLQPWLRLGIRTLFSTPPCQGPSVIILATPVEFALPVCEELAGGGKFHGALGMWSSSKEGLGYSLCPWQLSWELFPRWKTPHLSSLASGTDYGGKLSLFNSPKEVAFLL